jgi:hypothetical protein
MKRSAVLVAMALALCLAGSAWAMGSTNYVLGWFTPLTTGGGGPVGSANYAANFSVGQTSVFASASANYAAALGYWPGVPFYTVYLPLVQKG